MSLHLALRVRGVLPGDVGHALVAELRRQLEVGGSLPADALAVGQNARVQAAIAAAVLLSQTYVDAPGRPGIDRVSVLVSIHEDVQPYVSISVNAYTGQPPPGWPRAWGVPS